LWKGTFFTHKIWPNFWALKLHNFLSLHETTWNFPWLKLHHLTIFCCNKQFNQCKESNVMIFCLHACKMGGKGTFLQIWSQMMLDNAQVWFLQCMKWHQFVLNCNFLSTTVCSMHTSWTYSTSSFFWQCKVSICPQIYSMTRQWYYLWIYWLSVNSYVLLCNKMGSGNKCVYTGLCIVKTIYSY